MERPTPSVRTRDYPESIGQNAETTETRLDDLDLSIHRDPERMRGLVDAVARHLSRALSLKDVTMFSDTHWKDDDLYKKQLRNADTLGFALWSEARYIPSNDSLQRQRDLYDSFEHACRAEALANTLLCVSRPSNIRKLQTHEFDDDDIEYNNERHDAQATASAVSLLPYVDYWGYYSFKTLTDTNTQKSFSMGKVAFMLYEEVKGLAEDWLTECDRIICRVFDCGGSTDIGIGSFIKAAAKDIANQVTVSRNEPFECSSTHASTAFDCLKESIGYDFNSDEMQGRATIASPTRTRGAIKLPKPEWAPWTPTYWVNTQSSALIQANVAPSGLRTVIMNLLVLQYVRSGGFPCGKISCAIVERVATKALHQARVAQAVINHKRKLGAIGYSLTSFLIALYDLSSPISNELDNAQCELSHFSILEILCSLCPQGSVYNGLRTQITQAVIKNLGGIDNGVIPPTYTNFVGDALATLLPCINQRRDRQGVNQLSCVDPLVDLLLTLPAIHKWNAAEGNFECGIYELRQGHPMLRSALEAAANERTFDPLVIADHHCKRHHRAVRFTFSTPVLLKLLRTGQRK
jgi:hypothetical protein